MGKNKKEKEKTTWRDKIFERKGPFAAFQFLPTLDSVSNNFLMILKLIDKT